MTRLLLIAVCAFAAVSSSVAEALGLQSLRVAAFSGLVLALCAGPWLRGVRLARPSGALVCLFVLLLGIAVQDAAGGGFDPTDYKVALPLLVLLAAPALAAELPGERLAAFAWRLLSLYVLGTFAYQMLAEPAAIAHGYAGIVRYDPTGSVIMHASLSLICLVLALGRAAAAGRSRAGALALLVAAAALVMVLETATRTVVVTLLLFASFHLATTGDRRAAFGRVLAAALGLLLVFLLYSELWNPSFLLRLTSTEVNDYGSGRLPSLGYWLGLMDSHPFGLGFGAVRELMADGKPYLDGDSTLEWPHDEFVRFYVEAGPLGLLFALLLAGLLLRLALRAATRDELPARRTLVLVIAADILAEMLLQNLFNAIYHATVLVTFLALGAQRAEEVEREEALVPAAVGLHHG